MLKEEEKVTNKLKEVNEKKKKLREIAAVLVKLKDEIDVTLGEKEKNMFDLKQEWDTIDGLFEDSKKIFFDKKKELNAGLKKADKVFNVLDKIEKLQLDIDKKQKYIKNNVSNFNKREKTIKIKEDKLKKVKELSYSITDLENKLMSLTDAYHSLSAKVADKSKVLKKFEEEEKDFIVRKGMELRKLKGEEEAVSVRELDVMHDEDDLAKDMKKIKLREEKVDKEEEFVEEKLYQIEDKEFIEEMKHVKVEEKPRKISSNQEINSLIKEARDLINSGKVAEATSMIKQIQSMQRKLRTDDTEKRKINYDILDLETDVKLASL